MAFDIFFLCVLGFSDIHDNWSIPIPYEPQIKRMNFKTIIEYVVDTRIHLQYSLWQCIYLGTTASVLFTVSMRENVSWNGRKKHIGNTTMILCGLLFDVCLKSCIRIHPFFKGIYAESANLFTERGLFNLWNPLKVQFS